jgi:hypothetical protein
MSPSENVFVCARTRRKMIENVKQFQAGKIWTVCCQTLVCPNQPLDK